MFWSPAQPDPPQKMRTGGLLETQGHISGLVPIWESVCKMRFGVKEKMKETIGKSGNRPRLVFICWTQLQLLFLLTLRFYDFRWPGRKWGREKTVSGGLGMVETGPLLVPVLQMDPLGHTGRTRSWLEQACILLLSCLGQCMRKRPPTLLYKADGEVFNWYPVC